MSSHGNKDYAAKGGYGYSLIKVWLVVSNSIKGVASSIEKVLYDGAPSLAGSPTYQKATASLAPHTSAVMVLDLGQLRKTLEGALLPTMSPAKQAQYHKVQPLLVPYHSLTVSGGAE